MLAIVKSLQVFFLGCFLCLLANPLSADIFVSSPYCSKPYKPYEFDSQYELDNFNDEVQQFKRCISDFVDEQNQAARHHQQAAEDAIEEWNRFVNYELN
jgi:hypothetical protein